MIRSISHKSVKPVSVLYVVGSYSVGGAELSILKLCRKLDASYFSTSIIALDSTGPLLKDFLDCCDSVIIPPKILFPSFLSKYYIFNRINSYLNILLFAIFLIYKINIPGFNIVNFFLPASYIVGGISSFFTFKSVVRIMSRRSRNLYMSKNAFLAKVEFFLHGHMHALTGNSQRVISDLLEEGCNPQKVKLIYNGVDSKLSSPFSSQYLRSIHKIKPNALVLVMVANLIPYKGHEVAIKALKLFSNSYHNDWVCFFIGRDDGIQSTLVTLLEQLEIAENVVFTGSISNVADYYSIADIAMLTSFEEGFSNSVLEAMVCSLPLVVTDVGGNSEAVLHDTNGFVFDPGDFGSIAKGLLTLANNGNLRKSFGKNSNSRAVTLFSDDNFISSYTYLYKNLVR